MLVLAWGSMLMPAFSESTAGRTPLLFPLESGREAVVRVISDYAVAQLSTLGHLICIH